MTFAKIVNKAVLLIALVCYMACGIFFSGCDAEKRIKVRFEQELARIPEVLQRGEGHDFCKGLTNLVSALSCKREQWECYRKAIKRVFEEDVPETRQGGYVRNADDLWGEIAGAWLATGATRVDIWEARAWELKWREKQLKYLRAEYAKVEHQLCRPIKEATFKKILGLQGAVKTIEASTFSRKNYYEREFWRNTRGVNSSSQMKVRKMLEISLGRPIRTPEQVYVDCLKRSEEFKASLTNEVPVLYQIIAD